MTFAFFCNYPETALRLTSGHLLGIGRGSALFRFRNCRCGKSATARVVRVGKLKEEQLKKEELKEKEGLKKEEL